MGFIDYAVIGLYFVVMIGLGFWYRRKASKGLEAYFLGGRSMHWLALGMSGAVSFFDVTGTMWIVSILCVLGMKSMWVHWMWGFMIGAFCLAYMGKWCRRSNVMTGAEWMMTRFGEGPAGLTARTAAAVLAVFTTASMIGYSFQGIGKFASVYIGLPPHLCATIIFAVTTFYCLLGGLYSVVVTDVLQTLILTGASIVIAAVAYAKLTPELLAQLPAGWDSFTPTWRVEGLAGTANAGYELFGVLLVAWMLKGLLLNMGGPAQMYDFQRFVAARDSRDAAKVGAVWSIFLIVRWGLAMGIALLGVLVIGGTPDPEQVMPRVLHDFMPVGVRGFIIAGLLAAFMSTFSSTVNCGASYLVRDFWQRFIRPDADDDHLVRVSYIATAGIVVAGVLIGFQAESIAEIWQWIMMALGAGALMPNFLRWYWWRMNGWGYAAGIAAGILFAVIALFRPDDPLYVTFPVITLGSLAACVIVTFLTAPVEAPVLDSFYRSVRPFGFWGPVKKRAGLTPAQRADTRESPWRAALNIVLGMVAIQGYFLSPMYLVGHWHGRALAWFLAALIATGALAFTWYPYLPRKGEV